MDLKIKDVADLLNVSETTIRRWLADRKIPAYRINHQYRFNRFEIEDWVMGQKLDKGNQCSVSSSIKEEAAQVNRGSKQFSLYRALHKGGVFYDISGNTKEEVIRTTIKQLSKELNFEPDAISELLLDREKLHPTALNNGIAIPHTRDFLLNAHLDVVTAVFLQNPIEYGALDNKPVHTLFFLFASDDRRHLHLLAKIAHLSSQPETLQLLQTRPSKDKFLESIKDWESSVLHANCE